MKPVTFILTLVLNIVFSISCGPAFAQKTNPSIKSYSHAREVLLSGIRALGGLETIRGMKDITVTYKELDSSRGQNVNPQAPDFFDEGGEARYIYNAGNGFIRHERNLQRRGRLFNAVLVYKGDEGFFYWPETQELHSAINVNLMKSLFNFRFTFPPRLSPHLIVQTALKQVASLRWLGEAHFDGISHDVLTFSDADGTLMTLYFNRNTHLLAKTEELMDDLLVGDTVGEVLYPEYREVDGLQFPNEIVFTVAGEVKQRMQTLDVKFNTNPGEQLFQPPAGVQPSEYPALFKPQQLAEGVYFVPLFNGIGIPYNSMFVVFDDFVLVFDAPLSDLLSQFYIGLIKRVAPGKPIRYVVPTHHHSDHIGGIKRFVAEGATVVTTPGNEALFKKIVSAPRTLQPTTPGLQDKLAFEVFSDKKVFQDQNHRLELYNVGPNPHADEIVVGYLPDEKILYVTDMLWVHLAGHYPPARETLLAFAKKVEALGLKIETIAPGHGKVGTGEDLHRAVSQQTNKTGD